MGAAFGGGEAEAIGPHVGDGFADEGGHFFSRDLDEFSGIVGGWFCRRSEERTYWCVGGGSR